MGHLRDIGHDISINDFYAVLSIIILTSTFFFPVGQKIAAKYGCRAYDLFILILFRTIILGGAVAVISLYCSSYTENPTVFFILYSVGLGISKGLMYPGNLAAGLGHLPGRKGLVSGFIISAVGFGSFIFGILI